MDNLEIQIPQVKEEEKTQPVQKKASEPKSGFWWGTGRRKSSVARVRIKPGSGKTMVNKKNLDDYFKKIQDRNSVLAPLRTVKSENAFDIYINVRGGGTTGQAGAALLGIARALRNYDETFVQALRESGLYAVAVLSGLTDMDAITLSTARYVDEGRLTVTNGWQAILVAAMANLVFKAGIVTLLGTRRLLAWVAALFGVALVAGGLILAFWPTG